MVACSAIGIINILDWSLFNGSIYTIFMFLEVLLVGCLWKKRQRNLFVLDAFYWGIIGGPFATLVFYMIRGTVNVEGLLIVSNIVINGLINVFLADILISYIPIQRIFGYRDKGHIDLNKMIFHLTVAAVLGPFLAYTFVDTWFSKASLELDIFQNMNSTKVNITEKLKTWEDSDFQKLRLKSPIYINRFKTALSSNPLNNSVEVLLADNKSNIYFTSNEDKYGKNYNWRECGVYLEIDDNVYEC
jgi:hypothetical protein